MQRSFRPWAGYAVAASLVLSMWAPTNAHARRRAPRPTAAAVAYDVNLERTPYAQVEVRVSVKAPRKKDTTLALPAWTPGSYLVRDFARNVHGVRAEDDGGRSLPVTRLDKQSWRVRHGGRGFTLVYRVQATELSVRTSYVDDAIAVLNNASLLMYVVGAERIETTLDVHAPRLGPGFTALSEVEGRYVARDYDQLVDAPLTFGAAQHRTFEVDGTRFEYVLHAPDGTNADLDRLVADAEKIVRAAGAMMGGFPFKRYVFHSVCDPSGGGGLEHDDSTVMMLRPWSFDRPGAYRRAASLLAHEFFHAWNVKRIRDRVLGPFEYGRENYTDLLWFHEGFTETIESRLLLAAGLKDHEDFLDDLAGTYARYLSRPGRDARPMSEISRVAWVEGYKPAPHHWNTSISYYLKGALIGVALDLTLRSRSVANGRPPASIESLFRSLWALRDDDDRVSIDHDLIVETASALAGEDLGTFFARYVTGTEALPLPALLEEFGIVTSAGEAPPPTLGLRTRERIVRSVDAEGPAAAAGILPGDELLGVDGHHLTEDAALERHVAHRDAGATFTVLLARRGRLLRVPVSSASGRQTSFRLTPDPNASERAADLRGTWLDPSGAAAAPPSP